MSDPSVLVLISGDVPAVVASTLVASLKVYGAKVTLDEVSSPDGSTVEKVWKILTGELSEKRLEKSWSKSNPDVVVVFDPNTAQVADDMRSSSGAATAIVAVLPNLQIAASWGQTSCDRYLCMDDELAVDLAEMGVASDLILPIGFFAEHEFASASKKKRKLLREQLGISAKKVVTVEVDGLGYDETASMASQLSLIGAGNVLYLFDAGHDAEAAAALRQVVPGLDIQAKLFGATGDTPSYWRASNIVVAKPEVEAVYRASCVGAGFVALSPEGEAQAAMARSLVSRGHQIAQSNLLVASAIESSLKVRQRKSLGDGARNAAAAIWVCGVDASDIVSGGQQAASAETAKKVKSVVATINAYSKASSTAGGLEDLSGASRTPRPKGKLPDSGELTSLRNYVRARMNAASKAVNTARDNAKKYASEAEKAIKASDDKAAVSAKRKHDKEKDRMQKSLAEMGQHQRDLKALDFAIKELASIPKPNQRTSSDDMLEDLKRRSGQTTGSTPRKKKKPKPKKSSLDDELAALKRKMKK